MNRKSISVIFVLFFVGISLYSNNLKEDLGNIYKNILGVQKELVALDIKLNDKDFEDYFFIFDGLDSVKSRLGIFLNLLNLYNLIDPKCIASKKAGRNYIENVFRMQAEGNKKLVDFLHKYQSKFSKPKLFPYLKKYIKYNEQISLLIKKFQ